MLDINEISCLLHALVADHNITTEKIYPTSDIIIIIHEKMGQGNLPLFP